MLRVASLPLSVVAVLCLATSPFLGGCAGQECDLNSECPTSHYCLAGRCVQQCAADIDCPAGLHCSVIGQCVGDGGVGADAGPSRFDAGPSRLDAGPSRVDAGPTGFDAGPVSFDAGPMSNDAGPGADASAGADAGGATDAGPPIGPVPIGTYRYQLLPIALGEAVRVAFHPDGSYAIVLERSNVVHVYDWASRTEQRIDLNPPGSANVYFYDVTFAPDGAFAYLVGADVDAGAETGVIVRGDDAAIRAAVGPSAFTRLSETRAGERFTGIEFPLAPRTGSPIVLSTTPTSPYIARLRELDPTTGTFMGLVAAQPTSAGCSDLAFADNEFGGWGVVLVCGISGGDAPYYTVIGGTPTWRPGPAATLGNTFRAASHPSGAYAFGIGASGWGNIHRFESGAWMPASSSPSWTTLSLFGVAFNEDGSRALAFGRAGGTPLRAAVLEYRHDLWTMSAVTDVSIPGFGAPPYNADSNTYLNDAAFRAGCDGGLLVGGKTSFTGSRGLVIEFRIDGLRSCGGVL
ncbi:MAG: hypothetical protein AB7S26_35045 [Sandaracinaceae bacterium]